MKPAKIASLLLLGLVALFLILVIGAVFFISLYPKEKVLELAISKAETALGRSVSVKDFSYSFVGVSLEDVFIHEAGAESPLLASSGRVRLTLSIPALFRLRLDFDRISLENTRFNVTFDQKGKSNIERLFSDLSKGEDEGVDASISRLHLSDALISISSPPPPLAPLEGDYRMDATMHLDRGITIRDCTLTLPEGRGTLYPSLLIETSDKGFSIKGSVKLSKASLEWMYRWGGNINLPFGIVSGRIENLIITKALVAGDVKASSTLRGSDTLFRANGFCRIDIPVRTVSIDRTRCSAGGSSFTIDSFLLSFGGKPVRFAIHAIDASVGELKHLLPLIPGPLFGRIRGDLRYDRGTYNGNMAVREGGYDPARKTISGLNADISIADGLFKNTGIPFNFYGNPCLLSIASTDPSLKRLFINIKTDTFRINHGPGGFSGPGSSFDIPIEIFGVIEARRFSLGLHNLDAVHLSYRLSGKKVTIPGLRFIYADGTISGNGFISMAQGPPRASLFLDIAGLRVQNALSHREELRNRFFGVMNGRSNIDFEISGMILETAKGSVEFTIDRGKLVDTGIQKGLGILLSEMRYKLRDMEFNRIYGNIGIRGTNYLVNSFIFNSPDVRLKITGSFDRKLIAYPLDISLEFTREFIQDLPGLVIAPWLNSYLSGDWYTIPFVMTGDMTESKNMRRAD